MIYKKCIKHIIIWSLPNTTDKIKSIYVLPVPKGVTPSKYLWIAKGSKIPYKIQCFINRIKPKQVAP